MGGGERMRISGCTSIILALTWGLPVYAQVGGSDGFPFRTTGEFVSQCSAASYPEECLNAIVHVELVVNDRDHPNATCDGGTDTLLKARSNAELNSLLAERLVRVLGWLRKHPEYALQSYGDGVWAALRGAYCP